jgi:hypothetical protein
VLIILLLSFVWLTVKFVVVSVLRLDIIGFGCEKRVCEVSWEKMVVISLGSTGKVLGAGVV